MQRSPTRRLQAVPAPVSGMDEEALLEAIVAAECFAQVGRHRWDEYGLPEEELAVLETLLQRTEKFLRRTQGSVRRRAS